MLLRGRPHRVTVPEPNDAESAWAEADRLLNDPDAKPDPARIWELLEAAAAQAGQSAEQEATPKR